MSDITLRVAAKAIIVNESGKVLLLREADTYDEGTNLGKYQIPGGRLNLGESYKEGLCREAKEETGLEIEPLYPIYVGEWHPIIKGEQYQIIAIFTVCKAAATDIKLSEEHDDYKWVDPFKLPKNITIPDPEPEVLKRYSDWLKK
ncbi:NUDIX hydrolase [Candidatus Saccharibacteria bacterium]|nr:NUDIX hydrolase [Candidatus Saccharibacteria bacterium]